MADNAPSEQPQQQDAAYAAVAQPNSSQPAESLPDDPNSAGGSGSAELEGKTDASQDPNVPDDAIDPDNAYEGGVAPADPNDPNNANNADNSSIAGNGKKRSSWLPTDISSNLSNISSGLSQSLASLESLNLSSSDVRSRVTQNYALNIQGNVSQLVSRLDQIGVPIDLNRVLTQVQEMASNPAEATVRAIDAAGNLTEQAQQAAQERLQQAKDSVNERVEAVQNAAQNAAQNVQNAAQNAQNRAQDAVNQGVEAVGKLRDDAVEKVSNATTAITDAVSDAKEQAQDRAARAANGVRDAISGVQDNVSQRLGSVQDGIKQSANNADRLARAQWANVTSRDEIESKISETYARNVEGNVTQLIAKLNEMGIDIDVANGASLTSISAGIKDSISNINGLSSDLSANLKGRAGNARARMEAAYGSNVESIKGNVTQLIEKLNNIGIEIGVDRVKSLYPSAADKKEDDAAEDQKEADAAGDAGDASQAENKEDAAENGADATPADAAADAEDAKDASGDAADAAQDAPEAKEEVTLSLDTISASITESINNINKLDISSLDIRASVSRAYVENIQGNVTQLVQTLGDIGIELDSKNLDKIKISAEEARVQANARLGQLRENLGTAATAAGAQLSAAGAVVSDAAQNYADRAKELADDYGLDKAPHYFAENARDAARITSQVADEYGVQDALKKAQARVSQVAVDTGALEAAQQAQAQLTKASETVASNVSSAADRAKQAVGDLQAQGLNQTVSQASEKVKELSQVAQDRAATAAEEMKSKAQNAASEAKKFADEAREKGLKQTAADAAGQIINVAGTAATQLRDQTQQATQNLRQKADEMGVIEAGLKAREQLDQAQKQMTGKLQEFAADYKVPEIAGKARQRAQNAQSRLEKAADEYGVTGAVTDATQRAQAIAGDLQQKTQQNYEVAKGKFQEIAKKTQENAKKMQNDLSVRMKPWYNSNINNLSHISNDITQSLNSLNAQVAAQMAAQGRAGNLSEFRDKISDVYVQNIQGNVNQLVEKLQELGIEIESGGGDRVVQVQKRLKEAREAISPFVTSANEYGARVVSNVSKLSDLSAGLTQSISSISSMDLSDLDVGSKVSEAYVSSIQGNVTQLMRKLNKSGIKFDFGRLSKQQDDILRIENIFKEMDLSGAADAPDARGGKNQAPKEKKAGSNRSRLSFSYPQLDEFEALMESILPADPSEKSKNRIITSDATGLRVEYAMSAASSAVEAKQRRKLVVYDERRYYDMRRDDLVLVFTLFWFKSLRTDVNEKQSSVRRYSCNLFISTIFSNVFGNDVGRDTELRALDGREDKIRLVLKYIFWRVVVYLQELKLAKIKGDSSAIDVAAYYEQIQEQAAKTAKMANKLGQDLNVAAGAVTTQMTAAASQAASRTQELAAEMRVKGEENYANASSAVAGSVMQARDRIRGFADDISRREDVATATHRIRELAGDIGDRTQNIIDAQRRNMTQATEKIRGVAADLGGRAQGYYAKSNLQDAAGRLRDIANQTQERVNSRMTTATGKLRTIAGDIGAQTQNIYDEYGNPLRSQVMNMTSPLLARFAGETSYYARGVDPDAEFVSVADAEYKEENVVNADTANGANAEDAEQKEQKDQEESQQAEIQAEEQIDGPLSEEAARAMDEVIDAMRFDTFDEAEQYDVPLEVFVQVLLELSEEIAKMQQNNQSTVRRIGSKLTATVASLTQRMDLMGWMTGGAAGAGAAAEDEKEESKIEIDTSEVEELVTVVMKVGMWQMIESKARATWRARYKTDEPDLEKKELAQLMLAFHRFENMLPLDYTVDSVSLYHVMVEYDMPLLFSLLMKLNPDFNTYLDKDGLTPTDWAQKYGRWEIYDKILFADVGNKVKTKEKIDTEIRKLQKQEGFVRHFLNTTKENGSPTQLMQYLENTLIDLIDKRLPVSDDLMLLCWNWELSTTKSPADTRLWKALEEICNSVLASPVNRKDWIWFKTYLLGSGIWYQSLSQEFANKAQNSGSMRLYDKLVEISDANLSNQTVDFLKESVDAILMSQDRQERLAFDRILNYRELSVCEERLGVVGVRQDSIIEQESGKEMLSHPNLPNYDGSDLARIEFNLKQSGQEIESSIIQEYDASGYLSELIVKANDLSPAFHKTMKDLLQIDDKSLRNDELGINYNPAPVLSIPAAQKEMESLYADQKFPNAACVNNFISCSITCDDPKSMLASMWVVKDIIRKRITCLKDVVMIKNGFLENKRNSQDADNNWMYNYADIKFFAIMEYKKMSMVVEIVFLLNIMNEAKGLAYLDPLQTIGDNKEFINDMSQILKVTDDKLQQLLFYLSFGNTEENEAKVGELLVANNNAFDDEEDILFRFDESGMAAIHYACQRGLYRILRLFIAYYRNDAKSVAKLINLCSNASNLTPLMYAVRGGSEECVKFLLNEEVVSVNMLDNNGRDAVQNGLETRNGSSALLVWNDERFDRDKSLGRNVLHIAARQGEAAFVQAVMADMTLRVLVSQYLNSYDMMGNTPVIHAYLTRVEARIAEDWVTAKNATSCMETLAEDDRCQVMKTNAQGKNILMLACIANDPDVIQGLFITLRKDQIDVNQQSNEGKNALMYCLTGLVDKSKTLDCMKLLLQRPEINVTAKSRLRQMTALDYCAFRGFEEGVRCLLERNVVVDDIEMCTNALVVAAQLPAQRGNGADVVNLEPPLKESVKIAKMIIEKQPKVDLNLILSEACNEGHFKLIDYLMALRRSGWIEKANEQNRNDNINGNNNESDANVIANGNGNRPLDSKLTLANLTRQQTAVMKRLTKLTGLDYNINPKLPGSFKSSLYDFFTSNRYFANVSKSDDNGKGKESEKKKE